MKPSGAPRVASQGGKRSSKGMISAFPIGERPRIASMMRLTNPNHRPARAKRVGSSKKPTNPIKITRLDGIAKKPSNFESKKNMSASIDPRTMIELALVHRLFDNRIACTFVDPYPQFLRWLLRDDDLGRIEILDRGLQGITLDLFRTLESNDILFIDSTHVAKVGSDVNYIFAEILPTLRPGVYVHFHDIFYPFEYPKEWIYDGHAWNEAYLLRAFLTFNRAYEIVLFNTFLEHFHRDRFLRKMPLCLENEGGSIWLRRIA